MATTVYALIRVDYDYYRFETFEGVYLYKEAAIAVAAKRFISESSIVLGDSNASRLHDDEEKSHMWVCPTDIII